MECSLSKNEATPPTHNQPTLPLTPESESTGITTVALSTLQAIWHKAQTLLSSPGHILNAVWSCNPHARLVASFSSQSPHFVTTDDKEPAKYICDGNCPIFHGFSICAHVVAAAHHNRQLELFIQWYVETNCSPNLTGICSEGLPQGAGRKGGVPKRKRTKKPAKVETRSKRTNVSVQPTAVCPPPLLATTVIASSPVTIATTSTPPILSQTTALSMNAAQQAYPYSHGGSLYFPNTQQTTSSFAASRMQSPLSVCFPTQVPRLPPPLLSIHQSPGTSHASCYSWYSPTANQFPWRLQLPSTVAGHICSCKQIITLSS